MKKIFTLVVLMGFVVVVNATTFYSQGSVPANTPGNWNTIRTGGGTAAVAGDFTTAGNIFVIQNAHSMTTSASWTTSGTGTKVQIESGGTLLSTFAVATPNFQVDPGGTFIFNYVNGTAGAAADIPGSASRNFSTGAGSSNCGTVEIRAWGTGTSPVALPASVTWGNLKINVTTAFAAAWPQLGQITTINGDFTMTSLGTTQREFRFNASSPSSYSLSVGGDFNVTGGLVAIVTGSSTGTHTVAGALTISGTGTFTETSGTGNNTMTVTGLTSVTASGATFNGGTGNSTTTFNANGGLTVSGGTFAPCGSSSSIANINVTGNMAVSGGSTTVGTAQTTYSITGNLNVSSGTFVLGSSSSTLLTATVNGDINISSTGSMSNSSSGNNSVTVVGNLNLAGTSSTAYVMQASNTTTKTYVLNIGGNYNQNSACTFIGGSTSSPATISFTGGTTTPSFTQSAGTFTITGSNFVVANTPSGKTLSLNNGIAIPTGRTFTVNGKVDTKTSTISGAGSFILSAAATLLTANTSGISSSVTTTTRTLTAGANYEWNSAAAGQSMGLSGVTIGNPVGITISNTGGTVTADANITFGNSGTLTVGNGAILDANTRTFTFGTSGTATINGKIQSSNLNGISGGASTTLVSTNTPTVSLGASSTIEFNASSGSQTVTGRSDYANLTLTNAATKTLGGNASVASTLTLSSANILDIAANTLTIGTSGSISGASSTAYIATTGIGLLKMQVSSSNVTFPIGTSSRYNPIILNNNGGTADNYSIKVASGAPANTPTSNTNYVQNTWTISEAVAAGSNLAITTQWNASSLNTQDEGSAYTHANTKIGYYNGTGTSWTTNTATVAGSNPYTAGPASTFTPTDLTAGVAFVTGNFAILAPTTQASNISFGSVATTSMTVSWTRGNGGNVAVFVKDASGTITNPSDNSTYTASSNWNNGSPSGTQLGASGYYCVYNGTGTSVPLTNLQMGHTYYVQAFEYNGTSGTEVYYTATATNNPNNQLAFSSPSVTTAAASSVATTSVTFNGTVSYNGSSTVASFDYGSTVSYGSNITANESPVTTQSTAITANLSSLPTNTLYHFRAKGINNGGSNTTNGSDGTFTTLSNAPIVGTGDNITSTSFRANWTAPTNDGSETFTYTVEVDDDNTFGSPLTPVTGISGTNQNITGLIAGTTYYYRVKAVNAGGNSAWSATSSSVTTTSATAPTITTVTASAITVNSASSGGSSLSDGGDAITHKGVAWDGSANPTIALSTKTDDGTGTASFSSSLTSLSANTTYHYRAYATNGIGTSYGSDLTFTTLAAEPTTASSVVFGTKTNTTLVINFTGGDGGRRFVVVRAANNSFNFTPTDGTSLTGTIDADFGTADNQGSGDKIVYDGTGTTVTVTGLTANTAYYVRVYEYNNNTAGSPNYYATPSTTQNTTTYNPTITLGGSVSTFGNIVAGSNSAGDDYTVTGTELVSNITITPPTGFEISTDNVSFQSTPITLNKNGSDAVPTTTLYVRFSPSSANAANSGNVTHTATAASTQNLAVSGNAIAAEPTIQASAASTSNALTTSLDLGWTNGNGNKSIVLYSTSNDVATAHLPADASTYSIGNTLSAGYIVGYVGTASSATISSLSTGTTYYFAVFTYNDNSTSGAENYLTSSPATATGTTTDASLASDYFRSNTTTGNWNTAATWQTSHNGSTGWITSSLVPDNSSTSIVITSGNTITLDVNKTIDQMTVDGILVIANGFTLTVNNGTSTDITVSSTGLMQLANGGVLTGGASVAISIDGTFEDQTVYGSGTPYAYSLAAGTMTIASGGIFKVSGLNSANNTNFPTTLTGVSFTAPTGTPPTGGATLHIASGTPRLGASGSSFNYNMIYEGVAGAIGVNLLNGTHTVTGNFTFKSGWVYCGNGSSVRSLAVNGNVSVEGGEFDVKGHNSSGDGTAVFTLTVAGNVSVSGGSLYTVGSLNVQTTGGGALNIGGNISHTSGNFGNNNNTMAGTITLNGTSAQTISTTGIVSTGINHLVINNSSGATLSSALSINGNVTLTAGTLSSANNLTVAASATVTRTAGSFSGSPTYGTGVNITYNGTSSVSSGPELSPASGTLGTLTLSSASTVTYTLSNAIAVGAVSIAASNTLDVSNGNNYSISASGNWANAGTFTSRSGTVTFNGTTTISGTNTFNNFTVAASSSVSTAAISIKGDLTNNNNFTATGAITFNGTANQTISGSGGTMTFTTITVNNSGTFPSSDIVEVTSSAFTTSAQFLTLTAGIFKLSGSFTYSNAFFTPAAYSIPASTGIWLNNSAVSVSGQAGSPSVTGLIRVTAGSYTVGTAANQLNYLTGSSIIIEGGTMNIGGRLQPNGNVSTVTTTFNMSAGTLTLMTSSGGSNNNPNFDITANSSFTMSGGTIIIQNPSTAGTVSARCDYRNIASTMSITGGTLQLGNSSTPTSQTFNIGLSGGISNTMPTLAINTTNSPTLQLNTDIQVNGNVTISSGATLNANSKNITITGNATQIGNWTNSSGTFTNTGSTVTFNGTGTQTITKTGGETFNILSITNTAQPVTCAQAVTVNGTTSVASGAILATAGTLTTTGLATITGSLQLNAGGSINTAPTYSGTASGLIYNQGTSASTGNEWSSTNGTVGIGVPQNVTIQNSTALTLSANRSLTGNITLTSGSLADAGFTLTLAGNIAGTGTHSGTGKISMTGSSKTISAATLGNLEINSAGTITLAGSPSVTSLALTTGTFADGGFTLTNTGNITGTATHSGSGKISMTGTSKTIAAVTLSNLDLNSASTTSLAGSATISGALKLVAAADKLSIGSNTLTLNGSIDGTGSGFITGSSASNISIGGTGSFGSLMMDQSSLDVTNMLNNVTINRASQTITLGNALRLSNVLTPTDGVLASGGNLTIASTLSNTARIAERPLGSNGYITGDVTVERYITGLSNRAYRLLTSSVSTSTSINANWQEGKHNTSISTNIPADKTAYGTHITGTAGNAAGFDETQFNSSSLFTYNTTGPSWDAVTSTLTGAGATMDAKTGYLLFVRGNRDNLNALQTSLGNSNTTLRATGSLAQGTQTFSSLPGAETHSLVTNPYASPIYWKTGTGGIYTGNNATNFSNSITIWDPNIGTRGGFVTIDTDGLTGGGTTNLTNQIQSGQAFFVQSQVGAGPYDFVLEESYKSTTNNLDVYRSGTQTEMLKTILFFTNASGRHTADGVTSVFKNGYSTDVDGNDAKQIDNWDEDVAIAREGKSLSIEKRPLVEANDTISLKVARLKVQNYEWEFQPSSFNAPDMQAYLLDNYLGTTTAISLTNTTVIPFTVSSNAATSAANRFSIIFQPMAITHWTGASSTDFTNAANWDNGLPSTTKNAVVPHASNLPVLNIAQAVNSITLDATADITIAADLNIKGNFVNNGNIKGTGNIILSGSKSQTVTGKGSINNLVMNNANGISIETGAANGQEITGKLTLMDGVLNTNDNLTLKSTSITNTATVAPIDGTTNKGSIIGKVTVERFIPAGKRGFRFIAPGVTSTTSIKANWQENATSATDDPKPGYGTHITGSTIDQVNGFDATVTGNPSLFLFDNSTQLWNNGIANTDNTTLIAGNAYRLMVRGNRSYNLAGAQLPTNTSTILRSTGNLATGQVSMKANAAGATASMPLLASNADGYSFVGNPYVAALDWSLINKTDITGYYYIWDPTLGTRGAYVSCFTDGTKSNASSAVTQNIQPGQAFFVQNTSTLTTGPELTIEETHKSSGLTTVFRNASAPTSISMQLFAAGNTSSISQDGTVVLFSNNYSNAVDNDDAAKMLNLDENIAIARNNKQLSIERRSMPLLNDTVFIKLWQLANKDYTLQLDASNFSDPSLKAFVQDTYLNTETSMNISGTTQVPFTANSAIAASMANNRFRIVFRTSGALPVSITSVKAYQKNQGIQVEWTALQETNMQGHEVEKSTDGVQFAKMASINSLGNAASNNYSWFDASPVNGNNYYRIKSTEKTGKQSYSQVVKVSIGKASINIVAYPNPMQGNSFALGLNNLEKGNYSIIVTNKLGQEVFRKSVEHSGGISTQTITIDGLLALGTYQLAVEGKGTKLLIPLIKQ